MTKERIAELRARYKMPRCMDNDVDDLVISMHECLDALEAAQAELAAIKSSNDDACLVCNGRGGHEEGCRGTSEYDRVCAELERVKPLAEIGERWQADSSLEAWFPMTAEKLLLMEAKVRACGDAIAISVKQNQELERVKEQVRWRPVSEKPTAMDHYLTCNGDSIGISWFGGEWNHHVKWWIPFPPMGTLPEPPKGVEP